MSSAIWFRVCGAYLMTSNWTMYTFFFVILSEGEGAHSFNIVNQFVVQTRVSSTLDNCGERWNDNEIVKNL